MVNHYPKDWRIVLLSELSIEGFQNGLFYEVARKNKGIPIINVGDLYKSSPIANDKLELFNATAEEIKRYQVFNGDLFFTRSSIVPSGIAFCNWYRCSEKKAVVFDSHVVRFKTNTDVVNPMYLYLACIRPDARKYFLANAKTATMTTIDQTVLGRCPIPYPALKEQTAIAEAVSDADNLIFSLQKLIEKKKAIKQGALQELLTGKKRLLGFDEEWRTYKLGELGSFDKGCGISRAESNTGNFPAVRYGELYTKHTDYVKQYYSCISGDVAQTAKRVTFGDILFAASGETKEEIGVCAAIVDRRDIFAGGDIVVFTPTTEINPIFFGTLLNMPFVQKQKSERGQGDAVVHIHADSLSEIIISMPEKNEQEAIATVIKDFNDEIEQLERKLAKYQQIKQGMMQELLTGRIRLVDADDKEQPKTQIFQEKQSQPAHNQHFDDAVMIAGIVNAFYSEKYPLGRKKVQKLLYLVRRKEQADISAFHKKAAVIIRVSHNQCTHQTGRNAP